MIIYFSGTGNTRFCAGELASLLGDSVLEITGEMLSCPDRHTITVPESDTRIIWMFPVYSWGIPVKIRRMMARINISADANRLTNWMVCTCGDDIGRTARLWRRTMHRRGLQTAGAFSVQMPNTYVFMKGFNVDSRQVEDAKVSAAHSRLRHIALVIAKGDAVADDTVPGSFAMIKTAVIRPYFNAFCTSAKPFHATDKCVSCGKCAKSCPMENIVMADGKPVWGKNCLLCSRCYHICPEHAVAYGKTTANKGQFRRFLKK